MRRIDGGDRGGDNAATPVATTSNTVTNLTHFRFAFLER